MTYTKLVNGEVVEMTQEEVSARQAEETAWLSARLASVLPAYRYKKEIGGLTISGITIKTDEDSQRKWMGIKIEAEDDPNYTVDFKAVSGWVVLDAAQCITLAKAVSAHIKKCFRAEKIVSENIQNYPTEQQIKAAFDAAYAS